MFYTWESEEAFEAWHSVVKEALGIPYANKNSATGEIDENATWTTAYTQLETDHNGINFAKVEAEIAEQFAENLGTLHTPFFEIEENNASN